MKIIIENFRPVSIGIISFIVLLFIHIYPKDINNMPEILSDVVNFVAIITGFLTTTISILITVANTRVIKRIVKFNRTQQLTRFFTEPIIIGIILIIISLIGIQMSENTDELSRIILNLIISILVYFIALFFRVANITMEILKQILIEGQNKDNQKNVIEPDTSNLFEEK